MIDEIDQIREKLPSGRTESDRLRRDTLFNEFDVNGNGYLSLADIDKGCRDVLGLHDTLFTSKKVLMRAYHASKSIASSNGSGSSNDDYVERSEFRLLLEYLAQYYELWHLFKQTDTSVDTRISLEEFTGMIHELSSSSSAWGLSNCDPGTVFTSIDTNGGGYILFDEFSNWALMKKLSAEESDAEIK